MITKIYASFTKLGLMILVHSLAAPGSHGGYEQGGPSQDPASPGIVSLSSSDLGSQSDEWTRLEPEAEEPPALVPDNQSESSLSSEARDELFKQQRSLVKEQAFSEHNQWTDAFLTDRAANVKHYEKVCKFVEKAWGYTIPTLIKYIAQLLAREAELDRVFVNLKISAEVEEKVKQALNQVRLAILVLEKKADRLRGIFVNALDIKGLAGMLNPLLIEYSKPQTGENPALTRSREAFMQAVTEAGGPAAYIEQWKEKQQTRRTDATTSLEALVEKIGQDDYELWCGEERDKHDEAMRAADKAINASEYASKLQKAEEAEIKEKNARIQAENARVQAEADARWLTKALLILSGAVVLGGGVCGAYYFAPIIFGGGTATAAGTTAVAGAETAGVATAAGSAAAATAAEGLAATALAARNARAALALASAMGALAAGKNSRV